MEDYYLLQVSGAFGRNVFDLCMTLTFCRVVKGTEGTSFKGDLWKPEWKHQSR